MLHKVNTRLQQVFTTGQISKLVRVAPRTVSKWFDDGKLKGYRIPGSNDRRIPRDSLVQFLKKHNMPLGALGEGSGPKVFLIGHTPGDAAAIATVLTGGGCTVLPFGDDWFSLGCEFTLSPPDCIVMDGSLGSVRVTEFAKRLRAAEVEANLSKRFKCLLVLVAGADDTDHERFRKAGVDLVATHPANANELLHLVNRTVSDRTAY
jgi:excisionase family DNA binding protein